MKVKTLTMFQLIVFQLFLIVQLSSCQQHMQAEEYEWVPTVGASEEYPIRIIEGQFISNNGFSPNLPRISFVALGWGENGSVMVVGPDKKPVPDSLALTWLSFAENKFYRGRFALPQQKMADLLKEGYVYHYTNKREKYNYITVGLAPGGGVTLWLSGGPKQVEIANFQAHEVKLSKHDLGEDYAFMFEPGFVKNTYERLVAPEIRERAAKEPNQIKTWQKRYNWHFTVNSKAVKFHELKPFYFNHESEEIFGDSLLNNPSAERALPREVIVAWIDKKGQKMLTTLDFDENELRTAFARIPEMGKGELHFEVNPDEYTIAVTFKTGTQETKIVKQKAKTELESE
jgi:hypothetical protein